MLKDKDSAAIVGVKDLNRAKAFYGDTLGLEPDPTSGDDVAMYRTGGTVICVAETAAALGPGASETVTCTWDQPPPFDGWDVYIDVESDHRVPECRGGNNEHVIVRFPGCDAPR